MFCVEDVCCCGTYWMVTPEAVANPSLHHGHWILVPTWVLECICCEINQRRPSSCRTSLSHLHQIVLVHEHASALPTIPMAMTSRVMLMTSLLGRKHAIADLALPVIIVITALILGSMSGAVLDVLVVCVQGVE
jgi:hypothetical protein